MRRLGTTAALGSLLLLFAWQLYSLEPRNNGLHFRAEEEETPRYQTNWDYLSESSPSSHINIHLIAHTHDDAGWQVTAEEYQFSTVDVILDNVLLQLEQNPNRKFVYGEVSFLASWYARQSPAMQRRLMKLVRNGQLEIANGAWVQHDEACPIAGDMIDQTTRGHEWLRAHMPGLRPRIGWQLDPFGHSSTQAWLLTVKLGFNALFFARTDYKELEHRYRNATLEYMWRASKSFPQSKVFTSQFYGQGKYGGYYSFFPFEETNARDRNYVQDDATVAGYNLDEWIARVAERAREQAKSTQTSHQLWMLGNDFTFQSASRWFTNYDKLIHHINSNASLGIRMHYSTPSQYVKAKLRAAGKRVKWQVRDGDLMPLRDGANEIWSGYFTSRPALKRQYRYAANFLRAARQIETWTRFPLMQLQKRMKPTTTVGTGWTDELEGALAIMTHHDGITGTARQSVSNDYAIKLSLGSARAEEHALVSLQHLAGIPRGGAAAFCNCNSGGTLSCLNMSTCAFTSTRNAFTIVAWNSLARNMNVALIEIPVTVDKERRGASYQVFEQDTGESLPVTLLPIDDLTLSLPTMHQNTFVSPQPERNPATHMLLFEAKHIPSIGFATYRVYSTAATSTMARSLLADAAATVENGFYSLVLDSNQRLTHIVNKQTGTKFPFEITWGYYHSHDGDCGGGIECISKKSGAYLFRPKSPTLDWYSSTPQKTTITDFKFGKQIVQRYNDFITHTVRLYRDELTVEFTVGPIPIEDGIGKEVVVRYRAQSIASGDKFHTDSNGMETVERVRNVRNSAVCPALDGCDLLQEPVSSNYYPVTKFIGVADATHELDILVDAAQGGTSLQPGEVELMTHRRLLHDDFRGVEEPLNETMCGCGDINARPGEMGQFGNLGDGGCYCQGLTIRGKHGIILSTLQEARAKRRTAMAPLQLAFFERESIGKQSIDRSLLRQDLPVQVDLITLSSNYARRGANNGTLVRFAHLFELGEHGQLAKPVRINLHQVFRQRIKSAIFKSLSGFNSEHDNGNNKKQAVEFDLAPMEIKTLWIQFE